MPATRTETDSFGPIEVPADRYWGAQSQRSLGNFKIGWEKQPKPIIRALGIVKRAAAETNMELGKLDRKIGEAAVAAAQEVIDGKLDDHFPLVVWQTGSGTQSNMNANEVIANRANQLAGHALGSYEPVHPNDHVNKGQSSNDGFPVVMHVATVEAIVHRLLPAAWTLRDTLAEKAKAYAEVVMIGRTHLQDAVPITLGQVIGGWVAQIDDAVTGVAATLDGLHELAYGATAVGTGLNAHQRFGETASKHMAAETKLPFRVTRNHVAALSAHDAMAAASGAIRTLAAALMKMANDVRLYASPARRHRRAAPSERTGPSIAPARSTDRVRGLTMAAVQVFGNDRGAMAIHRGTSS